MYPSLYGLLCSALFYHLREAIVFFALPIAPVVVAGPLMNTHPLFALLWARLFLGQLERITFRLV